MKTKLLRSFRLLMASLFMVFATNFGTAVTVYASSHQGGGPVDVCPSVPGNQSDPADCEPETPVNTTVTWDGNGTEDPGCAAGQTAAFHWILTPAGGADVTAATLTVDYDNGPNDVVVGDASGNGAVHFNTSTPAPDAVAGASADITYVPGNGQASFVLTISDATCEGTPTDVCPNVAGNQLTQAECDVCLNIGGVQLTVGECDLCPLVPGDQASIAECDVCPLVEGVQSATSECDVCPNVAGEQSSVSQCDVCPNVSGEQSSLSECDLCPLVAGEQSNVSECDVCPNVQGTQSSQSECQDSEEVTLCHATGNPDKFVRLTVSAEGAFNGHLGSSHQGGRDIIPPFIYEGNEYSQNWDAEGQARFDSEDCGEPEEVTPAAVQFLNPTCANPSGRVVITPTTGVIYKIGDTVVTGTVSFPAGTSVTVTAVADTEEGYVLDGEAQTTFSHTFTAVPTDCDEQTDVCPNIEGIQTTVPNGLAVNNQGNCVPLGGRGGETPVVVIVPTTPITPAAVPVVLTTTPAVQQPQLADTGDTSWMGAFVAFSVMTLALALGVASRRQTA